MDFEVHRMWGPEPQPVNFIDFLREGGASGAGIFDHLMEIGRPDLAQEAVDQGLIDPSDHQGTRIIKVTDESLAIFIASGEIRKR